jgi:vacuolar protein sorting-associated protein IST1
LLKMVVSRIKLLKNKREIQCRQHKKDIASLLQKGPETSARLRVEHVFKEQNILDAYFLIEGFCYLVTERIMAIEKQKTCPNDLKEAIASLIFAAPRCADLPELQEVRSIFSAKYGHEFTTAAVELRPDSGVNRQIIEKLSTRAPSTEIKLHLLKEIAAENGVEWNFEKAEREMLKPAEDLLGGPKHIFAGSQLNPKPQNGTRESLVPEDAKFSIEPTKSPPNKKDTRPTSVSHSPPVLPPSPSSHHNSINKKQFLHSAGQGHARMHNVEYYKLPNEEEPVESPRPAGTAKPKISEEDPYIRLRMEGKMDYHAGTKTMNPTAGYQEFPNQYDSYHGSVNFRKGDGVSVSLTHDQVTYTDATAAAQVAFESAAHAAEAARAAVSLAKNKHSNNKSNQSGKDWKKVDSESELDEALEAALSNSINLSRNSNEDNSLAKSKESFRRKSSKTRKHETNYNSYPGSAFGSVHPSPKVGTDLNGEEPLEVQVSLSKVKRFPADRDSQQHFEDCNNDKEENQFSFFPRIGKAHAKHEDWERTETQSMKSMSRSASNSSRHSSFSKVTQPVFDNYDGGGEYVDVFTGSTENQRTMDVGRSENDESHIWSALYASSRPHFDDKDDQYEKAARRRQKGKEYDIHKIEMEPESISEMSPRPDKDNEAEGEVKIERIHKSSTKASKPSFKDFLRQETQSFESFNQSDEGARSLKDFERMKFQSHNKSPVVRRSQPEVVYEPSNGRASRQGFRSRVSSSQTTYPEYAEARKNYKSRQSENNYFDFQTSDTHSVSRYEDVGKAKWDYGDMQDEHIMEGRKPWDINRSTQSGIGEDDIKFQGLGIHLDMEHSVETPLNHDIHSSDLSKQIFSRDNVQSRHCYEDLQGESHNGEEDCKVGRVRQRKATHHGESCRSRKTEQRLRGQQRSSPKFSQFPPLDKEEERESTNLEYATSHNSSRISPSSPHSSEKHTHAFRNLDSMHDHSAIMASPIPPLPPVNSENKKQVLKSSKVKHPSEKFSSVPSTSPCTDNEFSERLEVLRRKR